MKECEITGEPPRKEEDTHARTNDLKRSLEELLNDYDTREENHRLDVYRFEKQQRKEKEETLRWAEGVKMKATEEAACIINEAKVRKMRMLQETSELEAVIHKEKEKWEKEKALIAKTQEFGSRIKLDVGGNKFTTSLTTLTRFPESMIGVMFSGRHALQLDEDGYCFIDRDGSHFRHILNFLRDPENFHINLSSDHKAELKVEADYYGLGDEMFPFVPAAERALKEDILGGRFYRLTCYQSASGIWRFNLFCRGEGEERKEGAKDVICCRQCHCGFISVLGRREHTYKVGVKKFLEDGRRIVNAAQAKPTPKHSCPCCGTHA